MIDGCSGGDDALFDVQKVADGVHVAVAARAYKVNCNTALIETDDGVLVVDSHSSPPRRGSSSSGFARSPRSPSATS
jgi:hypothetical protein